MNRAHKLEKGIGLVEVIAALGVAVVVITALVSLAIFTLRSSLQSKLLLEATKQANRELELVRAFRDRNDWATFRSSIDDCYGLNPCSMNNTGTTVNSAENITGTGLKTITRYFVASDVDGSQLSSTDQQARIAVTVYWDVGGEEQTTHVYTDLTNWRGL